MSNGQTTIRDIALKLNISISTVSRALRGLSDVNPETKKKVLNMARQLNYEPNLVAQSLRSSKTHTLGIIVPDVEVHFFGAIVSGIQQVASKDHYNVLFCQSNESYETELNNLHALLASRVDGIMISLSRETTNFDHLLNVQQKSIPLVQFDRVSDEIETSKVVVNDTEGAFEAVKYLIATGCKRIAYLAGSKNLTISNRRKEGYVKALESANIPIDESLIMHCDSLENDAAAATRQLLSLENGPDAIFCINDPVAIQAMLVIKENGLRIPDDVSVIGFTDDPVSALIEPSLTTVSQPSHKMGQLAAQLCLGQINGEVIIHSTTTLATKLILRNSTKQI